MRNTNRGNNYDSNMSRRELIRLLGLTSIGVSLGGLVSCAGGTPHKLRFYGTGTLDIEDWSKVREDLGIEILFEDNGNDTGPVITKMIIGTASEDYHIGGLQGGAERELALADTIIPWDLSKIPNWEKMWQMAKAIPYTKVSGKQYGLPIVVNADSIIYLPDYIKQAIPESNGIVDSYAYVFDERLKGHTSMEDAWINSVIFTAIYLKESDLVSIKEPGDLEKDELSQVMEFLIEKKRNGQFLKFWNGWQDGLELIESEKVWAMTGWEPIVYAAKKRGINAEYAAPKEGYEGWSNDLILHKGVESQGLFDIAHQFANWELGGYYGCKLAEMRGYVVPNDSSYEYAKLHPEDGFDANEQKKISDHVARKFRESKGGVYWQNVRPRNYELYERWWSRLRNT